LWVRRTAKQSGKVLDWWVILKECQRDSE
jgi:hypothetical protein